MSIQSRISAISDLGHFLNYITTNQLDATNSNENYELMKEESFAKFKLAEIQNPWFTQENILYNLTQWGEILNENNLNHWLNSYDKTDSAKNIGIIMAGNLPLVGLHDLLCVLVSGHNAQVKTSSKDNVLITWVIDFLKNADENLQSAIQIVEKLQNLDAVIATGSNNTARYFEYYFQNIPHIIRKNRTSVAILDGKESVETLKELGEDIFRYFGLGCRNVTKIYLPTGFNTDLLFEAFYDWNPIINHAKYANNYDYNRAIYLMGKEEFLDNNFVILRKSADLHSPLGVIHYEFYDDLNSLANEIKTQSEQIQCISSNISTLNLPVVPVGQTQKPSITEYADNIDTMKFLHSL